MFTGIVEKIGKIATWSLQSNKALISIEVSDFLSDVNLGDSISVNGICLTVKSKTNNVFYADISKTTIDDTTCKYWRLNDVVNLEKALTINTRLGGHLVSGHVDTIGAISRIYKTADVTKFFIKIPQDFSKFVVTKGSVAIDGTSLTVNDSTSDEFSVTLIPHTIDNTIIKTYREGSFVNIEVDLISRYLEKLLNSRTQDSIDKNFLIKHGFLN